MDGTFVPSLGNLEIRNVYLEVNEPMLFSAKNEFGDLYFVSYAKATDEGEAWIAARTTRYELNSFERGQRDIRDMFLNTKWGGITYFEFDDEVGMISVKIMLPQEQELQEYLAQEGVKIPNPIITQEFEMGTFRTASFISKKQEKSVSAVRYVIKDSTPKDAFDIPDAFNASRFKSIGSVYGRN